MVKANASPPCGISMTCTLFQQLAKAKLSFGYDLHFSLLVFRAPVPSPFLPTRGRRAAHVQPRPPLHFLGSAKGLGLARFPHRHLLGGSETPPLPERDGVKQPHTEANAWSLNQACIPAPSRPAGTAPAASRRSDGPAISGW